MLAVYSITVLFLALFAPSALGHGNHRRGVPALNPKKTNSLPTNGGPTLYYNGTGPVPGMNLTSPPPEPITPFKDSSLLEDIFYNELVAITANNSILTTDCQKCIAETEILHLAAITQSVETFTNLAIRLCKKDSYQIYSASCESEFSGVGGLGAYYAQIYAKMSMATGDMQAWCHYQRETCDAPPVIEIDESLYFDPKPEKANEAPKPSGETFDVLHLSDWHLDSRYDIGSEANCSDYMCCRPYSVNKDLNTSVENPSVPASRFGYLYCDSPADLALSVFDEMHKFFDKSRVSFTLFTGDIVSHDNEDQNSRAYQSYEEKVTFETFKAQMGDVPIYATLGNHDSLPADMSTPNSFNSHGDNIFSWNYQLLSSMWKENGWLTEEEAGYAATHYGAYAHTTKEGLRIISLNTDFWYPSNVFNFANFTNPDPSGTLAFLAQELASCEKKGQRAWIIGHIPSGYDGVGGLSNPTALFHSIVARYSPSTIAAVFFGHNHVDQMQIFYDFNESSLKIEGGKRLRNVSDIDYSKPLVAGWIGPSITPVSGLNAGYPLYKVDAKTFDVMESHTYFANMSQSLEWTKPEWEFEYDTRKTYSIDWPKTQPLNGAYWDKVTSQMLKDISLVEKYNLYETKSSVTTKPCNDAKCQQQTVCYIRSGNVAQSERCSTK